MPSAILSSPSAKPSLSIKSSATGQDVAAGLAVGKVSLRYASKIFRHMRENGSSVVDARVTLPVQAEIEVFAESFDQLANLNATMIDRSTTYVITSKGLILPLMMMNENTIKQSPEMLTGAPEKLSFTSILFKGNLSTLCEQAGDSSLLKRGLTSLQGALIDVTTLVSRIGW